MDCDHMETRKSYSLSLLKTDEADSQTKSSIFIVVNWGHIIILLLICTLHIRPRSSLTMKHTISTDNKYISAISFYHAHTNIRWDQSLASFVVSTACVDSCKELETEIRYRRLVNCKNCGHNTTYSPTLIIAAQCQHFQLHQHLSSTAQTMFSIASSLSYFTKFYSSLNNSGSLTLNIHSSGSNPSPN